MTGDMRRSTTPVLTAVIIGVVAAGLIMAGMGAWFAYLAKHGQGAINVLGQQADTATAGTLAMFIGAVTIGAGGVLRAFR